MNRSEDADEIDLVRLVGVVWHSKWVVVITTLVFAVTSVLFALSLKNIYKSQAVLYATEDSRQTSLTSLASRFGGLASIAGVAIDGGEKKKLAKEIIRSRTFVEKFTEKYSLIVPLIAAKGWDLSTRKLIIDKNIYDENNESWVRKVSPPYTTVPSSQEIYERFIEILEVSEDLDAGVIKVSIEFYSPDLSKQWVDHLVKEINDYMRNKDISEAEKSIGYLREKQDETSIAEMKSIFSNLIEEQIKTIMFAEIRDDYVFSVIDPAVSPLRKVSPPRAVICASITVFGFFLAICYALVRDGISSRRRLQLNSPNE